MHRDLLAWLVDGATLAVGVAAIAALLLTRRAGTTEQLRYEQAWARQLTLDHHARIYEAAAAAIDRVVRFTRSAEARTQARGTAEMDHGYTAQADESVDPVFASLLDSLGPTLDSVLAAHEEALQALDRLWFFISPEGNGEQLLRDINVVKQAVLCARPTWGLDAGRRDLLDGIDEATAAMLPRFIDMYEAIDAEHPMQRLKLVRVLATTYLHNQIGMLVPAPPLGMIQ